VDKSPDNPPGIPGGLRERRLEEVLAKNPAEALFLAVRRMLPKNRLGAQQLTRLRIFVGSTHEHEAQKPTTKTI
jgi:large subunit ribosomal protein L13